MDTLFSMTRVWRCIAAGAAALGLLAYAPGAKAQGVCGAEVKAEVAAMLASAKTEKDLLAMEAYVKQKFAFCADDSAYFAKDEAFLAAAKQCSARVSHVGNLAFEEMSCCGYDPQRRQFTCPVKVKQPIGFGAAPLPGSRLYAMHCVADGQGVFQPVGVDSVHLSNEMFGFAPPWQFGTLAAANQNLQLVQPMNGQTRTARSILSWALQPRSCDDKPYWGNAIDYPIRLDQ